LTSVPASEDPEGAELTTIKLSAMFKVVLFTVVVVPEMVKFPPIVVFPPTYKLPATPVPPDTIRAPVLVLLLAVLLATDVIPDDVNVPLMLVFPEASVPDVLKFPAVTCPVTPTPPATVRAPVLVVELRVELVTFTCPEDNDVSVVTPAVREPVLSDPELI